MDFLENSVKAERLSPTPSYPVVKRASAKELLLGVLSNIPLEWIERAVTSVRNARWKQKLQFCGSRVVISHGFLIERPELAYFEDDVSLGPNVSIMGAGGVAIRKNAMLATRTLILTTQHDRMADDMRDTGLHSEVEIGESAWIGAGVIILPGVHVGAHAVIGAGAVVTKNVPPFALALGIPARVVGDRRSRSGTGTS